MLPPDQWVDVGCSEPLHDTVFIMTGEQQAGDRLRPAEQCHGQRQSRFEEIEGDDLPLRIFMAVTTESTPPSAQAIERRTLMPSGGQSGGSPPRTWLRRCGCG